ncbi:MULTISPECIES: hypothetical protein [unclassified Clostridium]|uniref:hypothetical protein n=1 Tax=unclassified Clostridium TaxID=2614128 RepID=UPI003216512E
MNYRKKVRKVNKIKIFVVAITLISTLFILVGCKSDIEEERDPIINNYTSAVIEKNNNIYIFDEHEEYLEGVGDLHRLKELSALSNDWSNIAFKYLDEKDKINIYSMKDEEYKVLQINDIGENQISNISWMNNKLVVHLYIDPTTSKYLIYDADTLELLNSCEGILIDVLNEGNTIVYGRASNGVTNIYFNNAQIISLEDSGEVLLKGKVSPKKDEIAFITFSFDKEKLTQCEYLYRGKIENGKIKDVFKTVKPYEINGDIVYEGDELVIYSQEGNYLVKDEEFIEEENEEMKKKLNENSMKLKNMLKNTFESESINENLSWNEIGVFNITWFTR